MAHRGSGRRSTYSLAIAGLLAALLAASAWVSIPLGAVPVTLQTFVVVLCALLLSPAESAAAIGVYLVLGAAGAPVFSGGQGGLGVFLGPTGGYLVGFLGGAALGSALRASLGRLRFPTLAADAVAAAVCVIVVYAFGWVWLSRVTGLGALKAFVVGVAPFLVADAAKVTAAVAVALGVRRAGYGAGQDSEGWAA